MSNPNYFKEKFIGTTNIHWCSIIDCEFIELPGNYGANEKPIGICMLPSTGKSIDSECLDYKSRYKKERSK